VSVGALVRRRLGDEVLERLVDPMLAASRAGRADELGLAAAAPDLDQIARSHASLILGARSALRSTAPSGPPFLGLATGMQTLVDQLVLDLPGVEIRLDTPVTGIAERGASLAVSTATGEARADGMVITAPTFAASAMLQELSARAAEELRAIEYASGAVIALVYEPASVPGSTGSGVLVPTVENKLMTACAWFSRKWAYAEHPRGALVVRAFVGRTADEAPLDVDDDSLVARVDEEVREVGGIEASAVTAHVARWDKALPQYAVGHLDRLQRVVDALAPWPAVALGGAGYWGSGIPDCIRQGHAAAARVLAALGISRDP
jgi:oxygen-dependent protoporphyrinogen oxidase